LLAETITKYCDVFLPQRDGLLLHKLIRDGMNASDARNLVFKADVAAISSSQILVAVLDGRTIDEGVCFEIGYANALNIICVGLKTDDRCLLPSGDNPMIVCGCRHVFSTMLDLENYLNAHVFSLTKGSPV
jgi:nucleoside 2-deoxyribosyltransferase